MASSGKSRRRGKRGNLADLAERDLLRWIRARTRLDSRLVPIGPGDDAALLNLPSRRLLAKVDTIAEGVDFTLDAATPEAIGRKALAINLSDIAAMGGKPLFCLASVVLRAGLGAAFQKGLYRGLARLAEATHCPLVGGDVTGWKGGVVVTVLVCGAPAAKRVITRSGARPGDLVLVTGALGGSILGHHLTFTPRLAEGAWLAGHLPPTAMIDISDGLGVDAAHIADESGVAVDIDANAVPVSPAARRLAGKDGLSPLRHAIHDGEDFELLFTMPAARAAKALDKWPFKTKLTVIGMVCKGRGAWLAGGPKRERIDTEGYEHFGRGQRTE